MQMLKTAVKAVRGRSPGELGRLVVKNLRFAMQQLSPEARALRARDRAFDERWGTDTSRPRPVYAMAAAGSEAAVDAKPYFPSFPAEIDSSIDELGIDAAGYSFVDLGCGKGRVVLQASLRPFRQCVGVEFDPELADIARANLAAFRARGGGSAPIEFVTGDARTADLPAGPLVVYMYNPFGGDVMLAVRDRLATLEPADRPVEVIYINPECEPLFQADPRWSVRTRPGAAFISRQR
jgi:SAM-dependent methyltransferase